MDDLTVISDVLWFDHASLFPFKEHPNRFGAAQDDTIIGVKCGQVIHRGVKVRLHEVRSSDRGFRVDHEVVSKERSTSVR